MTMTSTQPEGTRVARSLWGDHTAADGPEGTFAEIFGDADRVRIALWVDRAAPAHGGLFRTDTCAADLTLTESAVRVALGPLQHVGMVEYRNGLHARCDHPLWGVLKVYRNYAGPAPAAPGSARTAAPMPVPDARAATFYFG